MKQLTKPSFVMVNRSGHFGDTIPRKPIFNQEEIETNEELPMEPTGISFGKGYSEQDEPDFDDQIQSREYTDGPEPPMMVPTEDNN